MTAETGPRGTVAVDESASGFSPVKVMVIDEECRPRGVPTTHPEGGRYGALWVLIRRFDRPVGLAKIPTSGDDVSAEQLDRVIDDVLHKGVWAGPPSLHGPPPPITVVVPTILNRHAELRECVDSLVALDYPALEIILVDNRPEPIIPVPEWLSDFPDVRLLHERQPGISAARNRGIDAAEGSIVAFTDDDVIVDRGWARAIAARLEAHPDEVAVTGLNLPRELETPAQLLVEEYYGGFGPRIFQPVSHRLSQERRRTWSRPIAVEVDDSGNQIREFSMYAAGTFGSGANMAFRTDVLRDVGGFDPRLGIGTPTQGGEDLAMFATLIWAGSSIGFEPAVLAHHMHRRDYGSLQRQIEGYGVGYTAMFLALANGDRRHLAAILATAPAAVTAFSNLFWDKLTRRSTVEEAGGADDAPAAISRAGLARLEIRGMARGPFAYARTRHTVPARAGRTR